MDRSQDQSMFTRGLTYTTLRLRTQRCTPAYVHHASQQNASSQGSPYTCPSPLLITHRITHRRLWPTHAYIKVNLLHHQGTHHFSQHLLHTLFEFHYRLERWGLMCLQAPSVPRRRLIAVVPEVITNPSENSRPPLLLNRSHWTDQKSTPIPWLTNTNRSISSKSSFWRSLISSKMLLVNFNIPYFTPLGVNSLTKLKS